MGEDSCSIIKARLASLSDLAGNLRIRSMFLNLRSTVQSLGSDFLDIL